jgi:hypothetical protein
MAALLNLLFLFAWGEPVTLHPCPAHDGIVASSPAAAAHHMDAASGHAAHAMAAMPAGTHGHHPDAAHLCSCLGHCCAAVGVVAPSAQTVRWQVVVRRRVAPSFDEPDAPRGAAPRLLPFANGPPSSA